MKARLFAANWKMHQAPADAAAFMRTFLDQYTRQQDRRVLFFPPAVSLHVVVEATRDRSDLGAGRTARAGPAGACTDRGRSA